MEVDRLEFLLDMDRNILLWIQDMLRSAILTPIFIFITHLGDAGVLWILISLGLLIPKRTRKAGVLSLVALLGSLLINNMILKNLIARTRPYEVIPGLQLLIEKQHDFSFPSGHAGSSFAAAVVFYRKLPGKFGIPALVLASLIAVSRLYVGVHYPSDVLCGMLIGIAIGLFVTKNKTEKTGV